MEIGERIKKIRLEKNMKQADLATKANISRVAVGNYERGDRQPNIETLSKIAEALGISANELLFNHVSLKETDELTSFLEYLGYNVSESWTPYEYQANFDEYPTEDYLIVDGHRLSNDDIEKLCEKLKSEIDFYLKFK